jgi:hypothetical protein
MAGRQFVRNFSSTGEPPDFERWLAKWQTLAKVIYVMDALITVTAEPANSNSAQELPKLTTSPAEAARSRKS